MWGRRDCEISWAGLAPPDSTSEPHRKSYMSVAKALEPATWKGKDKGFTKTRSQGQPTSRPKFYSRHSAIHILPHPPTLSSPSFHPSLTHPTTHPSLSPPPPPVPHSLTHPFIHPSLNLPAHWWIMEQTRMKLPLSVPVCAGCWRCQDKNASRGPCSTAAWQLVGKINAKQLIEQTTPSWTS